MGVGTGGSRASILHLDSAQPHLSLAPPWSGGMRWQPEAQALLLPGRPPRDSYWDGALRSDGLRLQPGCMPLWPWAFTSVPICEVGVLVIAPESQGCLVCTWSAF